MIANGYTEAAKTSQLISLSSRIYSFLTRFLVAYNIFLCYNEVRNIFSYVKLTAKLLLATTCYHVLSGSLSRCNDVKGKSASSNFTKAIDEAIKKEKDIETERMSYMTYEMKLQEMQDFGYNKGKIEGRAEVISNMLKNQMKPEQIAKIANMTVEQIISIGKKAAVL